MTTSQLRLNLNKHIATLRSAKETISKEESNLTQAQVTYQASQDARAFLQNVAQRIQTKAQQEIVKVVSKCLKGVFNDPYELEILFEQKRGKTEADIRYKYQGKTLNPKVDSGGVREVAALALRLASLALTLPPGRRLLILDEPFLALSEANRSKMAALIQILARDLQVQFIIATHQPELVIGEVINLSA
jgi:DNA repair exonuclease SbcCD ATPase subunit